MIAGKNHDVAARNARLNAKDLVQLQDVERARSFVDHVTRADKDGPAGAPPRELRLLRFACYDSSRVQCANEMNKIAMRIPNGEQIGRGIDLNDHGILVPIADDGAASR